MDAREDERMGEYASLQLVSIKVIPFNRFVGKEHWRQLLEVMLEFRKSGK